MLCIMFKLAKCLPIDYFEDYFTLRTQIHSYPTSLSASSNLICKLHPKTSYGYATFYYRAINMWNNLPLDLKDITSLVSFKKELKSYLLTKQNTRLRI